jgi:NDP-sugar pyrophosphorylase family protein
VGPEAEVRHCAFIRGNVLIGAGAVVGNSTELKNAILFDGVQAPHYNYVGDSILGYKAHLGAGAITSNIKGDKSPVVVKNAGELMETGLRKFGAVVGDFVEVGCNAVLNPGTVIGRMSMVYPLTCVRGVVPPRSIVKNTGEIVPKRD